MGANEKHAATYHGVTHNPDTDLVRTVYAGASPVPSYEDRETAFNCWLNRIRAEAKAEALLEAADVLQQDSEAYFKTATTLFGDDNTRYHAYASMLKSAANRTRKRANRYKETP